MRKSIQKAAVFSFGLILAVSVTACQKQAVHAPTTVPTMPAQVQSGLAVVQLQGSEELRTILDQIEANVFPGTAGCTLTAVPYTVRLLDWCKTAGISESELRTVMAEWLQGKDTEETARVFELVMDTYDLLMGDTAQELLDTAGCKTDSFPWPDSCRQVMGTILEAAGVDTGEK